MLGPDASAHGEVFVDCLFGSGLTRPLSEPDLSLLNRLALRSEAVNFLQNSTASSQLT